MDPRMWGNVLAAALAGLFLVCGSMHAQAADSTTFICRELLGRPTATSVALNVCADRDVQLSVEFGTQPLSYRQRTPPVTATAGVPITITIAPLNADTRYYYRLRCQSPGAGVDTAREEHSFHTARNRGSAFTFAIEADPHLDSLTNPVLYRRTLANVIAANPDFLLDLGDNFMCDKLPIKDLPGVISRHMLLRSFYDTLAHSIPLLLVLGNHEGELGWLLDGTANNLAVWATQVRSAYYPNPSPDEFYTGDTTQDVFVGLRRSSYAWEWGDALFVVLDPYWQTMSKPGTTNDLWDWTLGERQYRWFERTLGASTAGLKFVFAHQLVGGNDPEGRGGIEAVPYGEMGGRNTDSSWGFTIARPGWSKPLHQLMVDNRVTAFFHGHDHVFVKQDLDGVVYQELPQPGYYNFASPEKSYANLGLASKYGYTHGTILSSSGFLKVTVTDTGATVAYVRSYLPEHETGGRVNGETAFSYSLKARRPSALTAAGGVPPPEHSLAQNYPNPFNGISDLGFGISEFTDVRLQVFDSLGREVALVVSGRLAPGNYTVRFDGSSLASGVYLYRLTAAGYCQTRKMVVIR